jgi:N-acetyl-anhydromuramyl-L-alanine amidase AmpD
MLLGIAGCAPRAYSPGTPLARTGDEIVVCGQFFHTGTPVVLWLDPMGYDAYRVENRFDYENKPTTQPASAKAAPQEARYGSWRRHVAPDVLAQVQRDGWSLPELQKHVDLFVLHYDVCCTSKQCFKILHDKRNLSVHFMLDLDGTIYQTLDLKERAWHASHANDRSVGVEIANIGAYSPDSPKEKDVLGEWYDRDAGGPFVKLPGWMGDARIRTPNFVARPVRSEPVLGEIHGRKLMQFDLTPQQYDALIKLTTTLCNVLPRIKNRFPREPDGTVAMRELTKDEYERFSGILGHYHLTKGKIDPGPAFDWERLANGVGSELSR